MKTSKIIVLMLFMLVTASSFNAQAATTPVMPEATPESARAEALLKRLDEIDHLDKSNMKSHEKRQLRKEVKAIKKDLKELSGGVYLSVGAVIIIILLLILLL
jgi:hypothetical protein